MVPLCHRASSFLDYVITVGEVFVGILSFAYQKPGKFHQCVAGWSAFKNNILKRDQSCIFQENYERKNECIKFQ